MKLFDTIIPLSCECATQDAIISVSLCQCDGAFMRATSSMKCNLSIWLEIDITKERFIFGHWKHSIYNFRYSCTINTNALIYERFPSHVMSETPFVFCLFFSELYTGVPNVTWTHSTVFSNCTRGILSRRPSPWKLQTWP